MFPPGDLQRLMPQKYNQKTNSIPKDLTVNDIVYKENIHRVCHQVHYNICTHTQLKIRSLVHSSASKNVAGQDVRVIKSIHGRLVSVCGTNQHQIDNILIVTAGDVTKTSRELL